MIGTDDSGMTGTEDGTLLGPVGARAAPDGWMEVRSAWVTKMEDRQLGD